VAVTVFVTVVKTEVSFVTLLSLSLCCVGLSRCCHCLCVFVLCGFVTLLSLSLCLCVVWVCHAAVTVFVSLCCASCLK